MKIKIEYSKLEDKSEKELLKMKKRFLIHLMNKKGEGTRRAKGFAPREVKKNIAKINQILKWKQKQLMEKSM